MVFFESIKQDLDIRSESDLLLFNLYQLSEILGYATKYYLKNYYATKRKYIKIYKDYYTDLYGVIEILTRGRKPLSRPLLKEINKYTNSKYIINERDETSIFREVQSFFPEIKSSHNISCGKYFLDIVLYSSIPIVIEVDECGHAIDLQRDKYIKDTLGAKIIHVNPQSSSFTVSKLLKDITKLI